jgi:hypothetical protein
MREQKPIRVLCELGELPRTATGLFCTFGYFLRKFGKKTTKCLQNKRSTPYLSSQSTHSSQTKNAGTPLCFEPKHGKNAGCIHDYIPLLMNLDNYDELYEGIRLFFVWDKKIVCELGVNLDVLKFTRFRRAAWR